MEKKMQARTPAQIQRQARMQAYQMLTRTNVQTKEKRTREDVLGNLALDLGKLTFGGIVLAGIFSYGLDKMILISLGAFCCLALMVFGVYFIIKK
jgi:hypothetical protein